MLLFMIDGRCLKNLLQHKLITFIPSTLHRTILRESNLCRRQSFLMRCDWLNDIYQYLCVCRMLTHFAIGIYLN